MSGGIRSWARRVGHQLTARQVERFGWTDAHLRPALARLLRGVDGWPTAEQLRTAGIEPAIRRSGGAAHWAPQFNRSPSRRGGRKTYWTDERIEQALLRLTATLCHYPAQRDFATAGLAGLCTSIANGAGHATGPNASDSSEQTPTG